MAIRAFVAVPVPPVAPLAGLLEELRGLRADLKPVEPTQLHFTLSFLGDLPEDAVPQIVEALTAATRGSPAFTLQMRAAGAFPSARRPRVVWTGVADPKPISELAQRVRDELAQRDLPRDDKDFRAHLTLARVRSERGADEVASFLRHHGHDELGSVQVGEVILYRSTLGPRGPTYEALHRAPLGA